MTSYGLVHYYFLIAMFGLWVIVALVAWARYDQFRSPKMLFTAVWLWPLTLFDEVLRHVPGAGILSPLTGQLIWLTPVLLLLLHRVVTRMVIYRPKPMAVMAWFPVILLLALQGVNMWWVDAEVRSQWFMQAPLGQPLAYWPLYALYLINAFFVLAVAIVITEQIQIYHRFLPNQVVDVSHYKMHGVTGVFASLVGVAFVSVLLTTVAAFGFFPLEQWMSLYHLALSFCMLLALGVLVQPQRVSPSPLDYARLQDTPPAASVLQPILQRAEQAMLDQKAYKKIGLRLQTFAEEAGVDPTQLVLATRTIRKRNFRGFVYHYRLEYAKKVLMRSDAKVATVAKRLGFHSEKFLSGVFVQYMQNNNSAPD